MDFGTPGSDVGAITQRWERNMHSKFLPVLHCHRAMHLVSSWYT